MVVPTVVPDGCRIRPDEACSTAAVLSAVSRALEISVEAFCSRSRVRSVVVGRRLALLIWARHLGRPAVQMARALGIAASTASELLAGASRQAQHLALEIASSAVLLRGSHERDQRRPR